MSVNTVAWIMYLDMKSLMVCFVIRDFNFVSKVFGYLQTYQQIHDYYYDVAHAKYRHVIVAPAVSNSFF